MVGQVSGRVGGWVGRRRERATVLAGLSAALLSTGLLAGCGGADEPGSSTSTGSSASSTSSPSDGPSDGPTDGSADGAPVTGRFADGAWLLRVDGYSGEDGETRSAAWIRIVPTAGSGQTAPAAPATRMPPLTRPAAAGDQRTLLVDAGHRWVLADTRPARADRAAGRIRVTAVRGSAASGTRVIAMPRGVRADWVAFDARRPAVLRVISGSDSWLVPLDGSPRRLGRLPVGGPWLFLGGFDKNTGAPFVENDSSFRTRPPGNGELSRRSVLRDGGRLLITGGGRFRGLPDPGCDQVVGFSEDASADRDRSRTWAFCLHGTDGGSTVEVKTLAAGGSTWQRVGRSRVEVGAGATMAFALPPPR